MNVIIENKETGEVQEVGSSGKLPKGWRIKGTTASVINDRATAEAGSLRGKLEQEGVKWGDAVAWVTKRLGIHQCAPCQARQLILNEAAKNGWAETVRRIKNTF